jgi:hypothetical protein
VVPECFFFSNFFPQRRTSRKVNPLHKERMFALNPHEVTVRRKRLLEERRRTDKNFLLPKKLKPKTSPKARPAKKAAAPVAKKGAAAAKPASKKYSKYAQLLRKI